MDLMKWMPRMMMIVGVLLCLAAGLHAEGRTERGRRAHWLSGGPAAAAGAGAAQALAGAAEGAQAAVPAPAAANGSCTGNVLTKCYGVVQYCTPVDWNGRACAESYRCGWCFGWW